MVGVLAVRIRVDERGRITLPSSVRRRLGIRPGDELVVSVVGGRIVIEKALNPFERLAEILGDLTFDRSLRVAAEREALKAAEERWTRRHASEGVA
jgi:AbrB family looped-hinge helix DNA binding protein